MERRKKKRSASSRRCRDELQLHPRSCQQMACPAVCRVLEVSASGYYAWRCRPESARSAANRKLLGDVRRLHSEHHGRYGSPRMPAALRAEGRTASRGRVERLMRHHGIRALAGRRFRPSTTDSRHHLPVAPNLLKQESPPRHRTASGSPTLPISRRRRMAVSRRRARPGHPQDRRRSPRSARSRTGAVGSAQLLANTRRSFITGTR